MTIVREEITLAKPSPGARMPSGSARVADPPGSWRLMVAAIAGAPGNGVLLQAFGGVPMSRTALIVTLPAVVILAALASVDPRRGRLGAIATLLRRGGAGGLAATVAYDLLRVPLRRAFDFSYDPFAAVLEFGRFVTGRPPGDVVGAIAGWSYHVLDGTTFGMAFALIWPRGGALVGLAWAMLLQALLMATYPRLIGVPLGDRGFLTLGFVGHAVFGLVLGAVVRRLARGEGA